MSQPDSMTVLVYHPNLAERYEDMLSAAGLKCASLHICKSREEIVDCIDQADILFASVTFPDDLLARARKLKWIQIMGAGVEKITMSEHLTDDVMITRVKGSFGSRMAEYALGHILAVTQKISLALQQQADKKWQHFEPDVLEGSVLGVAGCGSIGREVARKAAALGVEVDVMDLALPDLPYIRKSFRPDELYEFLQRLDYLVICMPLTAETEGFFDSEAFSQMKPTAWVVNMARGALMVQSDLICALQDGQLGGAILDVFCEEPLPPDSPLWEMPNVRITPHIAGPALPEEVMEVFLNNLQRFRRGQSMKNPVDLERQF